MATINIADALSEIFQQGGGDQTIQGPQPRPMINIADIIAAGNAPKKVASPGRVLTLRGNPTPQNIVAQRPNTTPLINEGQYNNMPFNPVQPEGTFSQAPETVNLMDIVNGKTKAPVANNDIMGMDRSKFQMLTGALAHAIAPKSVGGRVGSVFGKLGAVDLAEKKANKAAAQTAKANAPTNALKLRKLEADVKKAEAPKELTDYQRYKKDPKGYAAFKNVGKKQTEREWFKADPEGYAKFKEAGRVPTKDKASYRYMTNDAGEVSVYKNGKLESGKGKGKTKVSAKAKSPENIRKEVNKVMVDTDKMYEIQKLYPEMKEMDAAGKRAVVKAFITGDKSDRKEVPGYIPTISAQAEYDKLPSGAIYLEDGKKYRKP